MSTSYLRPDVMIQNLHLRRAFVERVKPGRPHTDDALRTINATADVGDRLAAESQKLEADRNLTGVGRTVALAELARGGLARDYARASRQARRAPAFIQSQRAGLTPPKPDPANLIGEFKRQEVRNHLSNLPPAERLRLAKELAGDPEQAAAFLDAPAYLSGLDDQALKMPDARIYESLRQSVIRKLHGPRLEELEAQGDDYAACSGIASAVRHQLYKVSGLSADGFEKMIRPIEDDADR